MSESQQYQAIRRHWKHQYRESQRRQSVCYKEMFEVLEPQTILRYWIDNCKKCSEYALLLNEFKVEKDV